MIEEGWSRRGLIGGATLAAALLGLPGGQFLLSRLEAADAPSNGQRAMMREVANLVLPRTTTPGAGDAGAGDFAIVALAHGLDGARRPVDAATSAIGVERFLRPDKSLRHVDWLADQLNARAKGEWIKGIPTDRATILANLDSAAFAPSANGHPWRVIKGLILTGYYTSEIGATQELQYELTPGRFDPKIPLLPGARAWSSDWTAVDFG